MTPVVESAMERVKASGSKLWVNTLWNSINGGLSDDNAFMTSPDEVYGKLIDMGATMIQTDRPEFMIEYLRSRGLHD
jgi:glycerophosphoryl diester phosphodiesterase